MMDANVVVHVIQWLVVSGTSAVWECAQRMEVGKWRKNYFSETPVPR